MYLAPTPVACIMSSMVVHPNIRKSRIEMVQHNNHSTRSSDLCCRIPRERIVWVLVNFFTREVVNGTFWIRFHLNFICLLFSVVVKFSQHQFCSYLFIY